ncbi:MAG: exodeoxyribonuclease I, partial [Pseudomonadota bacterium]|nr:exodeoxyribonuclease I [Pseudomonadota bacterium]
FTWEDRIDIIDKFKEERFSRLAEKLIYEEKPELLPESRSKKIKREIAERIFSTEKQNWTTLPEFYRQIDEKRNKYEKDEKKMQLLNEYDEFAQAIEKKYETA